MGNCSSYREDIHVVVVGGGPAGLKVAHGLDPYCRVTLIDKREAYFVNFGSVRAIVEPGYESTLFMDYKKVAKRGTFIQGEVTAVTASSVTVRREGSSAPETIAANFIVLATGTAYPGPMKAAGPSKAAVVESFKLVQAALAVARNVVVVGGGPTAVEAAGEIKAALPKASVTLVHGGPALLSGAQNGTKGEVSPKFLELLNTKLAELGVVVKLNTRATRPAELPATEGALLSQTVIQTTGAGGSAALPADVTLWFSGATPATEVIRSSFPGSVDAQGYVNVTETLNLPGYGNVFVAGDIASSAVTLASKTATPAKAQGAHVVAAIRALMAGKPAPLFKAKASTMLALVLGRKQGLGYMDGTMLPQFIVRSMKGNDYFAGPARSEFTGSSAQ